MPLTDADAETFGPTFHAATERLEEAGLLRRRGERFAWAGRGAPAAPKPLDFEPTAMGTPEEEPPADRAAEPGWDTAMG